MLKRIAGAAAAALILVNAQAQTSSKDFNLNFYGFVRNDFYIDTYKGNDIAHEDFYLVPNYTGVDANGKDLNKQTSANLTALASRLGMKVVGPELLGAKTTAVLELDFGGVTGQYPNLFRIRHANVAFDWAKSKLLVGQAWHPLFGGGIFPAVGSFNTGAPFQAFNRSPQVRFDYKLDKLTLGAAAVYENQFTSRALETVNTPNQAQRNGVMPEINLLAEYKLTNWTLGVGGEVKRTKPRMTTTGTGGTYKSAGFLTSFASVAYAKYQHEKLMVTAKTYYGQNMTHLCILGGYAVASKDAATGAETYTNYNTSTSLLNIVYGTKWQVGLFAGYGKNLGTNESVYNNNGSAIVGGLLPAVQDFARVAPHLAYNLSKVRLVAEYELTTANYGTGSFDFSDGTYGVTHRATNNRMYLSLVYSF